MGVSKQATSKTVKELEALGLIRQYKIPGDQRVNMIEFTKEGISYMKKLHKSIKKAEIELARQIGEDELEQLRSTLQKSLDFYQLKH
jgi:DNA-binding MarR family transcriptional regulator